MYRIGLITSDSTLASIFDPMRQLLDLELVIASPDSDRDSVNVDLLVWHDRDAIGCVPAYLAQLGVPVMNLASSEESKSQWLGRPYPTGYEVADYYLIYPFDSQDAVTIFRYWLEQSRKHQQR